MWFKFLFLNTPSFKGHLTQLELLWLKEVEVCPEGNPHQWLLETLWVLSSGSSLCYQLTTSSENLWFQLKHEKNIKEAMKEVLDYIQILTLGAPLVTLRNAWKPQHRVMDVLCEQDHKQMLAILLLWGGGKKSGKQRQRREQSKHVTSKNKFEDKHNQAQGTNRKVEILE